jgi:hypothetical protein
MNRDSNLIILFFFSGLVVVILGFSYLDFENSDPADQAFLTQNSSQVFSANPFLSFLHIPQNPISLNILTFENSSRSPPTETPEFS